MRMGYVLLACAGVIATAGTIPATAQDFPTRPVTMVVPFPPGGAGDILSRMIGPRLEQKWGKPLVVENKPGAGSLIAAAAVQKATPDGYTLLIAPSGTMATNVTLYKALPYDPTKDFVPLALAAQTPFVLIVHPDLPVKTVADLIKLAKERDGKLSYASAGPGVPHHLFAELLKTMTGIKMTHVPYKGSMPSLNDVVAGHVPLMFVDLGPALPMIRAGKVRAIGVSTANRLAALPDVPPVGDTVPGFGAASWQMIAAPAKTPRPVVDKLHADFTSVLAMPEVKEQIAKTGMVPMDRSMTIPELQKFIASEIDRWGKVVKQAGIAGSQ
ncbi:MAG: Bug family tripartite tricarboxylate transporter substrate binding protein [Xanthobacteraceae bacterium]